MTTRVRVDIARDDILELGLQGLFEIGPWRELRAGSRSRRRFDLRIDKSSVQDFADNQNGEEKKREKRTARCVNIGGIIRPAGSQRPVHGGQLVL